MKQPVDKYRKISFCNLCEYRALLTLLAIARALKHAQPYTPSTKRCNLCTWEKYYITTAEKDNILNSRSELISTCRHRRKFLLSEYG